jgi:hypothetical protein
LFDDKRRLIPGGYRSSYRAVAIWQIDWTTSEPRSLAQVAEWLSSPSCQIVRGPFPLSR